MTELNRHTSEFSGALRALCFKRADVVACKRVAGVAEDAAVRILLDSGISGTEIDDVRHGSYNIEPRIVAATQVLRNHFSTQS